MRYADGGGMNAQREEFEMRTKTKIERRDRTIYVCLNAYQYVKRVVSWSLERSCLRGAIATCYF